MLNQQARGPQLPRHIPGGLFGGAIYPFQATIMLARTPSLWSFVVIPVLINLVAGIGLYFSVLIPGLQGLDTLLVNLPDWMKFLGILVRLLLGGGLLLAVGFLLVRFGVVLGAPWYGKLSEQLEQLRTGQLPLAESPSIAAIVRDIGRSLLFELKKLLLALSAGLMLLLLGLVPLVGPFIVSAGSIALSITIICLDFLDPPLERRRLRFRTKLRWIGRTLPSSAGFGLVCLSLISIPFVNLLTIPICITAGTLFFCDRIKPSF